jgi:uncharacterized protein YggE
MRPTFALLIITASLSACSDKAVDPRGVDRSETLLQVSAIGRAETRPDEARFSAGVSSRGKTAVAATQANNMQMEKVVKALEALGVEEKDIKTQTLTVSRIDYGPGRGGYEANNIVEVRVRKVDDAGKAVAAATGNGANVISGPDLRVSDKEAANKSAYAAAYKAARARAEAYAGAADLKISRILAIRDGGQAEAPQPYYAAEAAMDASATSVAPPVRPGLETSEVSVRVDFALTQK